MDDDPIRVPRQVLLFSGHRVDTPGRTRARFLPDQLDAAALAIAAALEALRAGPADLAFTQGSSGGDLLFAEACLDRGVAVRLLQPAPEDEFIEESVRASIDGDAWVGRYRAVRARLAAAPCALPSAQRRGNRFERTNEWLLERASAWGDDKVRVICLWDGAPSGGPGGTAHLVRLARRRGVALTWLDARWQ